VSGIYNIVNPILADRSILPQYLARDELELAWDFVCDAEQFVHDGVLWEIAESTRHSNPFSSLVSLFRIGVFPIEESDDAFCVFVP
jgi:hypothetical protein